MKAAIYCGSGTIRVEERPVPKPGPGEVRVRVGACGLCGSDLHQLGATPSLFCVGQSPGHEIAGTVDAVGADVESVTVGTRVAVEPIHSCGTCLWCRAGRDSICPEMELYGMQRSGGFAEYVVVPARRTFAVPADLPFPLAALAEPMAVAVHGLRRGALEPGTRVLVIGAGTIGLLVTAAAHAAGAGEILLAARHPHQAERGRALGAMRVIDEEEARPRQLASVAPSARPTLVVETVGGRADTLAAASAAVAPGGTIVVLGLHTAPVSLRPLGLLTKEVTLRWSNCYARADGEADFATAIRLLGERRDALGALVTHTVALAEVERAFALAGDKGSRSIKVSVVP